MRIVKSALLIWGMVSLLAAQQQTLDNAAVVKMKEAGLDDATIAKAIETSPGRFDTSVDGLIALKKAGVADVVITAILQKGAAKPASPQAAEASPYPDEIGVYYLKDGRYVALEPEILTTRTAMAAAAFSYGIKAAKINGWVVNKSSRNRLSPGVEFLIRAPEGTAATEYQILSFVIKNDRREVELARGRINISSGTHRNAIAFENEKVAKATYKIKVGAFKPGEYGVLPPGANTAANAASVGKIYSFGVE